MITIRQPQPLSPQESAFAAEQFPLVYAFLNENELSEDVYYDSAINGFLKAVKHKFSSSDTIEFDEIAKAFMSQECEQYDTMSDSEPRILSFNDCYESAHAFEETIADIKNTMEEAISSIAIKETMQSFTRNQREIIRLLMDGYSFLDIASMLALSLNALREEICSIQQKTMYSPLMNAA